MPFKAPPPLPAARDLATIEEEPRFADPLPDIGLHRGPLQVAPVSNWIPPRNVHPWKWGPTLVPDVVSINPKSFPWEADSPSMSHWMRLLIERFHVDLLAIEKLDRLSNHSIHGYEEANSIVWKLVKKHADQTPVNNAPAFVQQCVANAWLKLLKELGYRLPVR